MAKGNRANMQYIYHPQTWHVGAGLCVYAEAHNIEHMSAFQFIDSTTDPSTDKSTERICNTCTTQPPPENMTIFNLTFRYERINGWSKQSKVHSCVYKSVLLWVSIKLADVMFLID